MHAVAYRITGIYEIELIRPFREQLNEYHPAKASRCETYYEWLSFEDRRSYFRNSVKQNSCGWIMLADTMTGTYVG